MINVREQNPQVESAPITISRSPNGRGSGLPGIKPDLASIEPVNTY
jgi:hypothetical protein